MRSSQLICIRFCIGATLLQVSSTLLAQDGIELAIDDDNLTDYTQFVGGRDINSINYYGGPFARRDSIEPVLFLQMIRLGGYDKAISMHRVKSYRRVLQLVASGRLASYGNTIWSTDTKGIEPRYFVSEASVQTGEFVVGIYTHPNNKKALQSRTLPDIQQLTAVSSKHWVDWKTLESMDFNRLHNTHLWVNMVRMVYSDRADITLAPFQPNDDMSLSSEGLVLIPIPNVRIAINDSRHWVVSREHPDGERIFAALQRGMAEFQRNGRITRAYKESGFFNSQVEDWPILNIDTQTTQEP